MIDEIVRETLVDNLKASGKNKAYMERVIKLVDYIESGRFKPEADKIQNLVDLLLED